MPARVSLKETLEAATPGPWEAQYHVTNSADVIAGNDPSDDDGWVAWDIRPSNAALIALAPELAARLLEARHTILAYRAMHQATALAAGGGPCICETCQEATALLARLDQLGKEQT